MSSFRNAFIAICVLLASGCASVPPIQWTAPAAPQDDADCESISGVFANLGENLRGQKSYLASSWFPSLNPSLFVFVDPPISFDRIKDVSRVTLTWKSRNHLAITATLAGEEVPVRNLHRDSDEFECQGGVLSFSTRHLTGTSSSIGINTKKFSYFKADGFLIEQIENRDNMLVLILPLSLGWSDSRRYQELSASEVAPAAAQ